MAEALSARSARAPRSRTGTDWDGLFFPGEVARLLNLEHVLDYRQLKRLAAVVRGRIEHGGERHWGRYSIRDVASIRILIDICGGDGVLEPGRRLHLRKIDAACAALRRAGFSEPLLQVPMRLHGGSVLAIVAGTVQEPLSGQTVISQVVEAAGASLNGHPDVDALLEVLRAHARLGSETATIVELEAIPAVASDIPGGGIGSRA